MPPSRDVTFRLVVGAPALAALLLTTGCATRVRHFALDAGARSRIHSPKTVVSMSQRVLHARYGTVTLPAYHDVDLGNPLADALGAAIAALIVSSIEGHINSSNREQAESAAWPIRDSLLGFDARAALGAALTRELAQLEWLEGNTVEMIPPRTSSDPRTVLKRAWESGADVVLLVEVEYGLTPSFGALVVTAKVGLASRTEPKARPVVLYSNVFSASASLVAGPAGQPSLQDAARQWEEHSAQVMRNALDGAIADLGRMIAWDLEQGAPPGGSYWGPPGARQERGVTLEGHPTMSGYVVRVEHGRAWLRLPSGELCSVADPSLPVENHP